jgi:hypothetical protein
MKSGIVREDDGFEILIDGVQRTFRDEKTSAFAAARELKWRNRNNIIEVRDRSNGGKVIMLEDGRTG